MYCKNCGSPMESRAAFCTKCGCSAGVGSSYCHSCGQPTPPGASDCAICGSLLNPVAITPPAAPAAPVTAVPPVSPVAPAAVTEPTAPAAPSGKSKLAAGLLGIFLGCFGVHNFYLGFTGRAIGQLLITLLSCGTLSFISGIWGLIEGVLYLTGHYTVDAYHVPLTD